MPAPRSRSRWELLFRGYIAWLSQHLLNDVAAEVRQLLVPSVVQVPEPVLIQPEQTQNRRVEIAHRIAIADAAEAHFIRSPMTCPPFTPPPANHIVKPCGL